MIESIVEFLLECPVMGEAGLNINYLDGMPGGFSVEQVASEPVIKKYADGGALCRRRFKIATRQDYTASSKGNLAAAKRCEALEEWLRDRDRQGILPCMGRGIRPLSLEVSKSFAIRAEASVDARYEAEIELVYVSE